MARLGAVFPDRSLPLASQHDRVVALDALGYTDLWTGESDGPDAITPLALAAGWGSALRLGTAILSIFTRPPALMAMTAATMADAAPGGFVLGLGASSSAIVEGWNGLRYERPVQRARDLVRFLRAAFRGERVRERYDTFAIDGFALARAPASPPAIHLAALRPAMLELAAEVADGTILTSVGADDVAHLRSYFPSNHEVVAWLTVCPCDDADVVRAAARPRLAGYLAMPVYGAFHDAMGRGDALEPMHRALGEGRALAAAAAAIPDEVVDALVVHGTPEACHAHIQRFVAAGVTTPIIEVLPGTLDVGEALWALAPAKGR